MPRIRTEIPTRAEQPQSWNRYEGKTKTEKHRMNLREKCNKAVFAGFLLKREEKLGSLFGIMRQLHCI